MLVPYKRGLQKYMYLVWQCLLCLLFHRRSERITGNLYVLYMSSCFFFCILCHISNLFCRIFSRQSRFALQQQIYHTTSSPSECGFSFLALSSLTSNCLRNIISVRMKSSEAACLCTNKGLLSPWLRSKAFFITVQHDIPQLPFLCYWQSQWCVLAMTCNR